MIYILRLKFNKMSVLKEEVQADSPKQLFEKLKEERPLLFQNRHRTQVLEKTV